MWSRTSTSALAETEIDASGGVGENQGPDSHARENADRKRDLLGGISLVLVDPALHRGHRNVSCLPNDHSSSVSNSSRLREGWDLGIGNGGGIGERVGEGAEAGPENQAHLGLERGVLQDELCGGVG